MIELGERADKDQLPAKSRSDAIGRKDEELASFHLARIFFSIFSPVAGGVLEP
jgi:hypothetical protein